MKVLYIDIDSLRSDHLGCYGHDAPTSPNIDRLAEDAARFDQAYVANSPCMPSRAAFLTGRYGLNNGVVTHGARGRTLNSPTYWEEFDGNSSDWWTLPEVFFNERIQTTAVSSFPRHPSPWFYNVWHEFHHPQEPPEGKYEYFQTPRAEEVADQAIDLVDDSGEDDWFVYAQFWDPHSPYKRSDEEVDRFREYELPPHPTAEQIETHLEWDRFRDASDTFTGHALRHSDRDYDHIANRDALGELLAHYDAEIRYTDRHVGRLFDYLRQEGLYDDTLIVITADHGEEFGEHGLYREHWSTHDGTQKVPLLIKPPADQSFDPGPRDQLVTNVDLSKTLVDYTELDAPSAWQGRSLRPVVEDAGAPLREFIVFDHGLYTAQRAVRTEDWKFIRTYHPGNWADVAPDRQLYDMAADPWEQENLADDYPAIVKDLETKMAVWAEDHVGQDEDELKKTAREGPSAVR